MRTLAQSAYLDSSFDLPTDLSPAGTALENPYVYDAAARELKAMASQGLVEIVDEQTASVADEALISRLSFRRVR